MKYTTRILCLGLCLLLLLPTLFSCQNEGLKSAPLREGALRLAEHGKSDYRVVIGKDASEDTKKMAEEFVRYFEQICGAKLSIVTDETKPQDKEFIIGKTSRAADGELPYDELGQEGYAYADVNASIVMSGNTDRAVAYSVYAFLEERLGVLYLSADYEYIPKRNALDVMGDLENQSVPGFWYRDMGHIGHNDSEWMVKMRLNSRQSLGSENHRKNPFVGGGEGYADWFVHTIGKLAEMPKNDDGTHFNTQPCLTDENVYQTVLKNVRAWLEQYPDATIVSISQNDGTQESSMCACDNCKKIYNNYGNVQSALWIWFVGLIATELADEYPDVHFETLSYNFTTMPP
ncbi:MAG: DUF4838 domain-containing protein, partial [Clostridia bacterium]|nr:DUF4838 domain-containing protein [Clostridia bacterium]